MSFDKIVMASVCRMSVSSGHHLQSFITETMVEPRSGALVPQYKILCIRCGASLEELNEDVRVRRSAGATRRKRRGAEPEPALSSPPPPIGSSAEEELS